MLEFWVIFSFLLFYTLINLCYSMFVGVLWEM